MLNTDHVGQGEACTSAILKGNAWSFGKVDKVDACIARWGWLLVLLRNCFPSSPTHRRDEVATSQQTTTHCGKETRKQHTSV